MLSLGVGKAPKLQDNTEEWREKMLTTPKAVLIGLIAIAVAIVLQPITSGILVSEALAELYPEEFHMFNKGFRSISNSINGIAACRL